MRLVIFGLSVTSSWGNGHAALWRGLIRALHDAGHHVTFFERDVPYYAAHRDLAALPGGGTLALYRDWDPARARSALANADAAIVTSYCPDAIAATALLEDSRIPVRAFYDLDTPVTLAALERGEPVPYLGPDRLAPFDLVLSYTGGPALAALEDRLAAARALPLYGSADPATHRPGQARPRYEAALSYIGTYAPDRQPALDTLLLEPARRCPNRRFAIAGAQYPPDFPWLDNLYFLQHLPLAEHPDFYASSRLTLNVTRAAMASMGWCPSGRLFEAALCGVPIVSDIWPGIEHFFEPDKEIRLAQSAKDVLETLNATNLGAQARRARERVLDCHTARHRANELITILERHGVPAAGCRAGSASPARRRQPA